MKFLISTLAVVQVIAVSAGSDDRPNILYIFTDDQSHRTVSCYPDAYAYAHTPNTDRLAERGVRFDHAYIGTKCVPSRCSALTGRLQFATQGDKEKREGIPIMNKYWPTALRKNGYYTGMIGKWHWGKGAEIHAHGSAWDWSVVWDHGAYEAAGGYYYDQYVMINGAPQVPLEGYSTDRYTEFTVDFINERGKEPDKPWFFWLCYGAVHSPYTPADRHGELYLDQPPTRIPEDIYGPRPDKPSHMQGSRWKKGEDGEPYLGNRSLDSRVKEYNQAVAAIDDGVGKIIEALEKTGQLENTIIVFTADQGIAWGQHGLKNKIHPYVAAIKSPLIISNPKRFPEGKVCRAPVNGIDLIRTFHDLTRTEPDQELHGRDISGLLKDPESESGITEWNKTPTMMAYTCNLYTADRIADSIKAQRWDRFDISVAMRPESDEEGRGAFEPNPNATPAWFMIHDGRYKYIRHCYPDRIEELYDQEEDPGERVNLAVKPEHKARLLSMREALIEELKRKGGAAFADILPEPKTR